MSTEGHQRDFIISRERESYGASRGFSTLNSGLNVPASHTITKRGFDNVVKIPNLLSNKNANHTIQNEFMGLRNSRGSTKNIEAGRVSTLTAGRHGGVRSKNANIITTGSQLEIQQARIKKVFESGNFNRDNNRISQIDIEQQSNAHHRAMIGKNIGSLELIEGKNQSLPSFVKSQGRVASQMGTRTKH